VAPSLGVTRHQRWGWAPFTRGVFGERASDLGERARSRGTLLATSTRMTISTRLAVLALVVPCSVGCALDEPGDLASMAQEVDRGTYAVYQNGVGTATGMATPSVFFEVINSYRNGVGGVLPYAQPIGQEIPPTIVVEGLVIANCGDGSQPWFHFVEVFDRSNIATDFGNVIGCPAGTRVVESLFLLLVDF
jgi:hypothetical protein